MPSQQWCDRHGWLSSLTAEIPGRWRTIPYQRAWFEAFDDPSVVEIVFCIATQTGKTAWWTEMLGYIADQDPGPVFIATSVEDSARMLSKTRIYPTLQAIPQVNALLPKHKRDQADLFIDLQRMLIFFGWSGSVTSLGEKSIRYTILTELDKWSTQKTQEADPEMLVDERAKAFRKRKTIKESTPTIDGLSRIWRDLEASSFNQYWVPCPKCNEFQLLIVGDQSQKGGLKWESLETGKSDADLAHETAYYECVRCAEHITDEKKPAMLDAGEWKPKHPKRHRRVGFQLGSLYSPFLTFGDVAEAFVKAAHGTQRDKQGFVNAWKAETWKEIRSAPNWNEVKERLSTEREPLVIPPEAYLLTAGADVQQYRVYWTITAWGKLLTAWHIASGECAELDELKALVLDPLFPVTGTSEKRFVQMLAVDSKYRTDEVYDFCRANGTRTIPIRAEGHNWRAPFTISDVDMNPRTGRAYPSGLRVYHFNLDFYKSELVHRLRSGQVGQDGSFNLHAKETEDYLRQLCGEAKQEKYDKRNQKKEEWVILDTTVGNHYLDCEVGAFLAADVLGIRFIQPPQPKLPDTVVQEQTQQAKAVRMEQNAYWQSHRRNNW